jgi:hypothetical protein
MDTNKPRLVKFKQIFFVTQYKEGEMQNMWPMAKVCLWTTRAVDPIIYTREFST